MALVCQLNLALIICSIDPTVPTAVIMKPTRLNALRRRHSLVQALIFFWAQYISTGK